MKCRPERRRCSEARSRRREADAEQEVAVAIAEDEPEVLQSLDGLVGPVKIRMA